MQQSNNSFYSFMSTFLVIIAVAFLFASIASLFTGEQQTLEEHVQAQSVE